MTGFLIWTLFTAVLSFAGGGVTVYCLVQEADQPADPGGALARLAAVRAAQRIQSAAWVVEQEMYREADRSDGTEYRP